MGNFTGRNISQVQLENRSILLNLIKSHKGICRKDLSEISGLTGAAVTNLIRDLINLGIVTERTKYQGSRSKNAISLQINYEKFFVIGISFRRGSIKYGIADLSGKVLIKHKVVFDLNESVDTVFKALSTAIDKCLEEYDSKGKIIGLGLASPGPINIKKGEISYLTNVKGWKDVQIKKYFEDKYEFPVILVEAANAAAIAEKWFGCAKESKNIISILVGKGVGAGIVLNNKLVYGDSGYAGEIGHVSIDYNGPQCSCGNRGCLELYCSTLTLLKKAQEIYGAENIKNFDVLFKVNINKNVELMELIRENGRYLGYAIVNVINAFNPELVVINSEISKYGDLWLNAIKFTVKNSVPPEVYENVTIKYSTLVSDPVFLGAIAMVCEYSFENPQLKYFDFIKGR